MEHVRLATLADAKEIAAIYAPFVAETHVSFEEVPPYADRLRTERSLPTEIIGRVSGARCTPRYFAC